jgi:hypothetical protein
MKVKKLLFVFFHHSSFILHPSLEAMKGVEPLSSGLQDRRSDIQLSYIAIHSAECRLPIVDWVFGFWSLGLGLWSSGLFAFGSLSNELANRQLAIDNRQ